MSRELRLSVCALSLLVTACGSEAPQATTRGRQSSRTDQVTAAANEQVGAGPAGATGSSGGTTGGDGGVESRPPPLPLSDGDLTESDRTRDPFRSFATEFLPVGPDVPLDEHVIKLREFALDQLHLVAVILGTDNPYAMLVDGSGRGTIVRRGDYVGRPDTIVGGEGNMAHQVPWRLARIVGSRVTRDSENNLSEIPGEVVFEREDRLNTQGARAERVITLTPGGQATRAADNLNSTGPSIPSIPGLGNNGSPFLPSVPVTTSPVARQGNTYVQQYTQVVPPQAAQQAPATTVVVQTVPTTPTPTGPRDPYLPPPGGTNIPPPVQVNEGPTTPVAPLPTSGLQH